MSCGKPSICIYPRYSSIICKRLVLCCVSLWFGIDQYYQHHSGLNHWHSWRIWVKYVRGVRNELLYKKSKGSRILWIYPLRYCTCQIILQDIIVWWSTFRFMFLNDGMWASTLKSYFLLIFFYFIHVLYITQNVSVAIHPIEHAQCFVVFWFGCDDKIKSGTMWSIHPCTLGLLYWP